MSQPFSGSVGPRPGPRPVDPRPSAGPEPVEAVEAVADQSAPTTGLAVVDEELARLADLDERPVADHHEALAAAHEALHRELQSPPGPDGG